MSTLNRYVKDVLSIDSKKNEAPATDFALDKMIRSFGDWTLGRLHLSLKGTRAIPCGKKHDEEQTSFEYCDQFGHNLVCGHTLMTENFFGRPLRSAASLIATSSYVVDRFGTPISAEYIPKLEEFGERSWKIDGAAYAAFDGLREHVPGKRTISVPDAFRQPELEAIRDIVELRAAIRIQEEAIAPDIVKIRDEVLAHYEKALGM